jgi:hypothetical protein
MAMTPRPRRKRTSPPSALQTLPCSVAPVSQQSSTEWSHTHRRAGLRLSTPHRDYHHFEVQLYSTLPVQGMGDMLQIISPTATTTTTTTSMTHIAAAAWGAWAGSQATVGVTRWEWHTLGEEGMGTGLAVAWGCLAHTKSQ